MPRPRSRIEDEFVQGRACAICGTRGLKVVRLPGVPDHVGCSGCGSAFVVEDGGERVMYGKIPAGYPLTCRFALRQWAWLEAIERRALHERKGLTPAAPTPDWLSAAGPSQPGPVETTSEEPTALPDWMSPAPEIGPELAAAPTVVDREQIRPPAAPIRQPPAPPAPAAPAAAPAQPVPTEHIGEPPPGERYRVVIKGERVAFPTRACAHCLRSPAPARLAVVGTWPTAAAGKRRSVTLNLPLCESCRRRASARSEAERTARLQAHLFSALIALALLVVFLLAGLVDVSAEPLVGGLIIAILLALGYGLPALVLLGRVGRLPPPDAVYVRSTLLVAPDSTGLETAFEWRNRHYAELFYQANLERVSGAITPIKDRLVSSTD